MDVIEKMLEAAWNERKGNYAYTAFAWKNCDDTLRNAMLAAARRVANEHAAMIRKRDGHEYETPALDAFLAPFKTDKVKRGLTWADVWEADRSVWKFGRDYRGTVFSTGTHTTLGCEYAARRDFEVSTNATFDGEEV